MIHSIWHVHGHGLMSDLCIDKYATFVFDCDGVVLNSNKVKTEAFYLATLPYGEEAANEIVDYHIANGGISRYKKFAHFLEHIIPKNAEPQGPDLEALLQSYADFVQNRLLSCEMAPGLKRLRQKTPGSRWLIVSGGDETELRDVFTLRGIAEWFDGGIFGSPDSKNEILARELATGNVQKPTLFLGDSKYDYHVARNAGLDFVFLSGWSDVTDWECWVSANGVIQVDNIHSLLNA